MKVSWLFYITFIFTFLVFSETNSLKLQGRSIAGEDKSSLRHVVFDLDWTLFSEFDPTIIKAKSDRVFSVEGKSYYLSPYAEELIRFLTESNIKVSFFSGGNESRNIGLLEKAKLKDGKTFQSIAFKILSKQDLTVMSADETLSFADRYKKDLTKITDNLEMIILIEDNKNFALDSVQARNIFWLGPTYQVLTKMEDVALVEPHYLPPTNEALDLANHKMLIIKEAIREALLLEKTENLSFKDAMYIMQRRVMFESQKYNQHSRNLKNKGLKFLPTAFAVDVKGNTCQEIISPLISN